MTTTCGDRWPHKRVCVLNRKIYMYPSFLVYDAIIGVRWEMMDIDRKGNKMGETRTRTGHTASTIKFEELDVENKDQTGLETVTVGQLHREGRLQFVLDGTRDYATACLLRDAIELLDGDSCG